MPGDPVERNGIFAPPETIKSIDNRLARDVKFICMEVGQICPDLFG